MGGDSPDRSEDFLLQRVPASAAARKSKGKRQKAKVLIGKALTIFALVGYFCRAALVSLPEFPFDASDDQYLADNTCPRTRSNPLLDKLGRSPPENPLRLRSHLRRAPQR